jgi:hypothetical protein
MRRAAAGVLVLLGLATLARAQEPAAGDERQLATLVAQGLTLTEEGKLDEAAQALARAEAIVEQGLGLDHPTADAALGALTRLRLAQDDTPAALLAAGRRVEAAERRLRRSIPGASPAARATLAAEAQAVLGDYLLVTARAGYSGYPTVLRFKGLVGRWAAVERRAGRVADGEERALRESLAGATAALAKLTLAPPGDDARAWRESIVAAQARVDELVRDLSARSSIQREGEAWLGAGVREVLAALREGEALVDVVLAHGRYTAWVLRPKKAPARLDLGPAQAMDDACARVLTLVRAAAAAGETSDPEALDAAVQAASDLAWRPLEAAVGAVELVYLVPDGALAGVPFALLETSKNRPLLETRTIVHLEAAQDLVSWRDGRAPGRGFVGLENADFGAAADGVAPLVSSRASSVAAVRSLATTYAKAYPEQLTRVLDGAQAAEGALRGLSSGKRVVHLATPGFAALEGAAEDPMVRAGLALAQANARTDDGVLTALEAAELDLCDCDLVVLPSCDGADDAARAGAGVQALVRGFRTAGARNVVTTLWPAPADATAVFMTLFYDLWLGQSEGGRRAPPVAAREAALALRELVVEVELDGVRQLLRPFEDPIHWAPFVTYGPAR